MKILLGMSGGLDSTYAAKKLLDAGHTVEGAVLIMHDFTEIDEAYVAAKSVGIALHEIDCRKEFESIVVKNFISEYPKGRTPNPCVICNSEIKFKYLLDYAEAHGFDAIATGHYARVLRLKTDSGERFAIARSADSKKDQTYVLWRLPQQVLAKLVFPLSDDQKCQVRESAKDAGISAADRDESQEICFIPDGDYATFIEDRVGKCEKGRFVDSDGNVLGEHRGIIHYTVGQRKGLGIAMGARIFVTDINPKTNDITLSYDDPISTSLSVSGIVFSAIREMQIGEERVMSVKLRYLAPPILATVIYRGAGRADVLLSKSARAVTPGQSAVFYDGDVLVAGGFIE